MRELLAFSSLIDDILQDLIHAYYGDSKVDGESLSELFLENVGRAKEDNLWLFWPPPNETTIFIQEPLLQTRLKVAQPHFTLR